MGDSALSSHSHVPNSLISNAQGEKETLAFWGHGHFNHPWYTHCIISSASVKKKKPYVIKTFLWTRHLSTQRSPCTAKDPTRNIKQFSLSNTNPIWFGKGQIWLLLLHFLSKQHTLRRVKTNVLIVYKLYTNSNYILIHTFTDFYKSRFL